jgi:hypothetical protein
MNIVDTCMQIIAKKYTFSEIGPEYMTNQIKKEEERGSFLNYGSFPHSSR